MKNFAFIVLMAIGLTACGGDSASSGSDPGPETTTSKTYNGAGSKWTLKLNSDNSCNLTEEDSSLSIDAICESLETGFLKIKVTSATGANAPSVDAVTYGFELSGYMLPFVSFTDNKLLPTIVSGNCPAGDVKHNFIVSYAKGNSSSSDFDGWGTFGYWESSSVNKNLIVKVYDRTGALTDTSTADFDIGSHCSDGSLYLAGQGDANTTAYFSESGGLIWNQVSTTDDRIENDFMIPYEDGVDSLNKLDGDYIGYTISGNGQSSYKNTPVNVSASNGIFTLKSIDLESGSVSNSTHSLFTLNAEVSGTRGLFQGLLTEYDETVADNSEGIGCAVDLNAGDSAKNVIICGGMLPDGTKKNLYSAILVSK